MCVACSTPAARSSLYLVLPLTLLHQSLPLSPGFINSASKAGTLMFLRLVFADEMAGSQLPLMAVGAASLVGQAALTTPQQRQLALNQLRRRTAAVPRRFRRAAAEMASGKAMSPPPLGCPCSFLCPCSCPAYITPPPPRVASSLLHYSCAELWQCLNTSDVLLLKWLLARQCHLLQTTPPHPPPFSCSSL